MLKLKELRFKAIGRFVDEQIIAFDSLGSLVQVDGINKNTQGSSGSGKTTIFNVLDYLLGLNDLPATVLQSRLTKELMHAQGLFDWDGKSLSIIRNKKGLSVEVDGSIIEGSNKLTEEKIDEILGMPRTLFRKILHKRQKEGGFFLDFTPSKMYEFLTDCLNLSDLRKKAEKIDKKIKDLMDKKIYSDSTLRSIQSALKATQDGILALGMPPVKDIHQPVILQLKAKFEASTAALNQLLIDHKAQNDYLYSQRPITPPVSVIPAPEPIMSVYDESESERASYEIKEVKTAFEAILESERNRKNSVNNAIQERKINLSVLNHRISLGHTAKSEALKLASDIKKIRESICPTCEQNWVTDTAKSKEAELISRLSEYKIQIQNAEIAVSDLFATNTEIENLQKELISPDPLGLTAAKQKIDYLDSIICLEKQKADLYRADIVKRNKDAMNAHNVLQDKKMAEYQSIIKANNDEMALKQSSLRKQQSIELEQIRGQTDIDRRAFEAAVDKLKNYQETCTRYENSLHMMKEKERESEINLSQTKEEYEKAEEELVIAEEIKKAIKTFASYSFDEALESIGDCATKIIRCIPNMSNATIQFEGQKETKEGKVKEEVNAVISVDGEEGIPIKSLSGGERTAVDLAVDLAVIDFIENRTGKGIDLFVLDEPFNGLDTVSIEMSIELLKNLNMNKRLIIIDHNPEAKQMIESSITVIRDGITSSILQV